MSIAVVIPCTRYRGGELQECLDFMGLDDRRVAVYLVADEVFSVGKYDVTWIERGRGVNLARWYNLGLKAAMQDGFDHVLYCESDVRILWDDVVNMRDILEYEQLGMVGPDFYNRNQLGVRRKRGAVPIWDRIAQCFVVPATSVCQMDEDYRWWFEADDLEWRMREWKGTRLVSAPTSFHPFQGTTRLGGDHDRARAIEEGRAKFRKEWGSLPF